MSDAQTHNETDHECGPDCLSFEPIQLEGLTEGDKKSLLGILKKAVRAADPKLAFNRIVAHGLSQATDQDKDGHIDAGSEALRIATASKAAGVRTVLHAAFMCIAVMRRAYPEETPDQLLARWNLLAEEFGIGDDFEIDIAGIETLRVGSESRVDEQR